MEEISVGQVQGLHELPEGSQLGNFELLKAPGLLFETCFQIRVDVLSRAFRAHRG